MRIFFAILLFSLPLFCLHGQKKEKPPKYGLPQSQFRLLKHKAIKVDPASFLVNEFRFIYESRLYRRNFYYLSPYGHHWYSPKNFQRQTSAGLRAGLEKYFFTDYSPEGIFLRLGLHYRLRKVSFLDAGYAPYEKLYTHSTGLTAALGRQWIFSPWKDLIWGFSFGGEYLFNFYDAGTKSRIAKNWYQLPMLGFLDEIRIFASLEIGFALRQEARHW